MKFCKDGIITSRKSLWSNLQYLWNFSLFGKRFLIKKNQYYPLKNSDYTPDNYKNQPYQKSWKISNNVKVCYWQIKMFINLVPTGEILLAFLAADRFYENIGLAITVLTLSSMHINFGKSQNYSQWFWSLMSPQSTSQSISEFLINTSDIKI